MPSAGVAILPSVKLNEIVQATFDFTSNLAVAETISTQVCVASLYSGTDPTPSLVIQGSASASGSVVSQDLKGNVLGVIYEILCTITTSASQTLKKAAHLACVPDLP